MTLIPNNQSLFIVDLHYIESFAKIEPLLDAHVEFLERNYALGHFVASGPKVPRTGGVIIATAKTREILEGLLKNDPFHERGIARYTVTEFNPSMKAPQLDS